MKEENEIVYSVYVLQSLKDLKYYRGLSSDVQSRVQQHNAGKVRSTKSRRPFKLVYQEEVGTLSEARQREKYLKTSAGRKFIEKMLHREKVSGSLPA